jgi:hypothetical protein
MGAQENEPRSEGPASDGRERRSFPRHEVDCPATVTLLSGSGRIACRMVDLSRGGCRLAMPERTLVGILTRVEVQFQVRGIAFRIVGVTAGTRTGKSFAVRFLDLPRRREEELGEVLAEVAVANLAAGGKPEAVSTPPAIAMAAPAVMAAAVQMVAIAQEKAVVSAAPLLSPVPAAPTAVKAAKALGDRRASNRHAVDTRANLILVKGAIRMSGQILNLSLGGCRVRTDERFSVGIYTRVEAEFYLHGLPFRVGGVSQTILDKNTVGIRFLDMSERRRDQLTELMAEIAEAEADRGAIAREPMLDEAVRLEDSAAAENL